jgi:Fe-Mn family superoxide dismutase
MLEPKPLKYKELKGISERQLNEHHDVLYAGYVKKYNEITEKLKNTDTESANATYSEIRELNVEKTFALNGLKLHEYYFDNMTDKPVEIGGSAKEQIEKRWGSVENWQKELIALGISARGWVVLAWDDDLKVLDHYICDAHNQGGIWNNVPVMVMDVYEHAYFIDYGTARKDYINSFIENIDWEVVNARLAKIL